MNNTFEISIELDNYNVIKKEIIIIEGMTCSACSSGIESSLKEVYGIKNIQVNLITQQAIVEFNSLDINIRDILNKIDDLGFNCYIKQEVLKEIQIIEKLNIEKNKQFKLLIFSIVCGFLAFINMSAMLSKSFMYEIIPGLYLCTFLMFLIATPMQFIVGKKFYKSVFKQIYNKKPANMDTLIILSTTISYFTSIWLTVINILNKNDEHHTFFESSVFIFLFVYIGKFLELTGKISAAKIMNNIVSNNSNKVLLVKNFNDTQDEIQEIDDTLININDILLIKQNTQIPCDGKIIKNESYVDESLLTGESKNVHKKVDSIVYGGTINVTDNIYIKALETGNNMTINRIKKLVENAQINKTQIQNITDIICKWFVYIVIFIAIIDFIVWLFVGYYNQDIIPNKFTFITFALYISVSVIVVACPCALGLATPIAIMVGSGKAMSNGILLKDGADSIEKMSKVNTIVFDKTGTLTQGKMTIVDKILIEDDCQEVCHLEYLQCLTNISNHPLSKCLNEYITLQVNNDNDNNNNKFYVTNEKIHLGKGVECEINNKKCFLGSVNWLNNKDNRKTQDTLQSHQLNNKIKSWESKGYSIVLYKYENDIIAGFAISDKLKENAFSVIEELKKMNIDIWLLTGDNLNSALKIANEVGIINTHVVANLLPESKAEIIEQIQNDKINDGTQKLSFYNSLLWNKWLYGYRKIEQQNKIVAMIGDGGNDSIALAKADISISMKSGCDLALSSSNIVLLKNDLFDIVKLKKMSNKIMKKIYINLFWAMGYNIIGIPLAAGVFYPFHLNPIFAALTMSLSSLVVVLNSLFLF